MRTELDHSARLSRRDQKHHGEQPGKPDPGYRLRGEYLSGENCLGQWEQGYRDYDHAGRRYIYRRNRRQNGGAREPVCDGECRGERGCEPDGGEY